MFNLHCMGIHCLLKRLQKHFSLRKKKQTTSVIIGALRVKSKPLVQLVFWRIDCLLCLDDNEGFGTLMLIMTLESKVKVKYK